MRALLGAPTPTAISLTPAASNLDLDSFNVEASSQLRTTKNNPQLEYLSFKQIPINNQNHKGKDH